MNFTNIIYVFEHDVSLGDSLTNFHAHLSLFKERLDRCRIFALLHPRTYNTHVHQLLLEKGLIDYVFPVIASNIESKEYSSYLNILRDIDIVIYPKENILDTVNIFKKIFFKSTHLQCPESNFGLENIYTYLQVESDEYISSVLKDSYRINNIHNTVDEIFNNSTSKKIGLFIGSTREYANVNEIGLNCILEGFSSEQYIFYLLGTSKFNIYDPDNGVSWNEIDNIEHDGLVNLIGYNWIYTSKFMSKLDVIISGPTGAAMIPPLYSHKTILLNGGDSPILEACLNGFTDKNNVYFLNSNCINFPCDPNIKIKDKIQFDTCREVKRPQCLNESLDIMKLKSLVDKII